MRDPAYTSPACSGAIALGASLSLFVFVSVGVGAFTPARLPASQNADTPTFEVASVRIHTSGQRSTRKARSTG